MLSRPRVPGAQPTREPAGRNNIFIEGGSPQSNCHNQQQLARAYVPVQSWTTPFSSQEALSKGTIFPELYRPCVCRD